MPNVVNITVSEGVKGDRGADGQVGPKGDAFTYADFTPEQLEALKGPKGDKGDNGPQGEQGIQGITGPQGLTGPKGDQGLKGDKGDNGLSPTLTFTLEDNGDLFVDTNYGVTVAGSTSPADTAPKTYDVIWGVATAGAPGAVRGYLEYSKVSGFGKLHLDMNVPAAGSGNGVALCSLPNDAPTPIRLLEISVDSNNHSVYVEPNTRIIKGWGVPGNKRYILDIVGFWKETK